MAKTETIRTEKAAVITKEQHKKEIFGCEILFLFFDILTTNKVIQLRITQK